MTDLVLILEVALKLAIIFSPVIVALIVVHLYFRRERGN